MFWSLWVILKNVTRRTSCEVGETESRCVMLAQSKTTYLRLPQFLLVTCKPYIISVPHTGTNFLTTLFQAHGFQVRAVHTHFSRWREETKGHKVVVPLRRPEAVYTTWYSRDEIQPNGGKRFWEAWELMSEIDNELPCIYLPIDHPDRAAYLEALGDEFDTVFSTDWSKEASMPRKEPPPFDVSKIYEMNPINRIYGSACANI